MRLARFCPNERDAMFWNIIGILAAITITSGFIPQIITGIRTRRLDDVSPGMYALVIFGMIMWIIYGIHLRDTIIIAANTAGLALSSTVLTLRFVFKRNRGAKKRI